MSAGAAGARVGSVGVRCRLRLKVRCPSGHCRSSPPAVAPATIVVVDERLEESHPELEERGPGLRARPPGHKTPGDPSPPLV
jgi:hypothetical protein